MKLKDWRKSYKLTQATVAGKLGVMKLTVGRYERGERRPDLVMLKKIHSLTDGQVCAEDFFDSVAAE